MRSLRLWLLAVALVGAACAPQAEPVTTTTVVVPPATTAPPASTTTEAAPITTEPPAPTPTLAPLQGLRLKQVAGGLPFPTLVTAPPNDPRLFVATKDGRIWVIADGVLRDTPFLDITGLVRNQSEQGLLGVAFHPDYAANGRFFVHYSAAGSGRTQLASYRVDADDPHRADPGSAELLLEVSQPAPNHNGGMLLFGPDGYLYLGLGDGGGANDAFGQGQRADTLLGTILRLDVDVATGYAIPADNPFAAGGGAPEVWAYGLRNPWRFWFDAGLLYIGDVGQNAYEEVDVAPAGAGGLNYGWPITEGLHCFRPRSGCDTTGLTLPAVEVSHGDAGTCSITGGVVYRGEAIPEISGNYFYSDWCGGYLRSFRYQDGQVLDSRDWTDQVGVPGRVASFGTDAAGEVYLTTGGGEVYRLEPVR